jgi:adenylyltransferase/sulfurtransferase
VRDDEISVEELKTRLDRGERPFLLDVREPREYALCNLGGVLIPQGELPGRLDELDPSKEVVVYCRTGRRSAAAVELLKKSGFKHPRNLAGGIVAWADRIDPSMPKY